MKLDCDFHCQDERLRPWIRQLALDKIHRVLKPLVSVQMSTINADFHLSLPVFCYNNILHLQKRS